MRKLAPLLVCSVVTLLLGGLVGCGQELRAFAITEVTESDCSQGEAGQINCVDPEALQNVSREGRWSVELVGSDKFVLTTENGRVLPGVHFANTGVVISESCTGEGGRCFFTRSRTDSIDAQTGCLRIVERVIDVRVDDAGALTGQRSDVQFVDECESNNIRQVIVRVTGVELDEPVRAKEGVE